MSCTSSLSAKLALQGVNLYYGTFQALGNVSFEIPECSITAIIGPSGCGKSSLLRLFNRMNDLIPNSRIEGSVYLDDQDIYGRNMDVISLRRRVGMVFQKPNVFPMSIIDNLILAPRQHGISDRRALVELAEQSLTQVGLWDEVKDILNVSGLSLPLAQQQRLCIARTLATGPEVILMDESCSALDPEATLHVEELMMELAERYTIIIVTHNMEQAVRVSDMAAFMMLGDNRIGTLIEFAPTVQMFSYPKDKRTEDYITGRYG